MEIEQRTVTANGITQAVRVAGPPDGTPLLLIHGNCSSSLFWEPLIRRLPPTLRVVAPDLRGYGDTETAPVDATRGLRDFADDVAALLDAPTLFSAGTARPVVVGHSLGGGVAMRLLVDHPERVRALLLAAPVSPYGFGGTRDLTGSPTTRDFAGTGAGTANPDFVARLAAGDRDTEAQASPRAVLRATYVATRPRWARTRSCCWTACSPPRPAMTTTRARRCRRRTGRAWRRGSGGCSTRSRRPGSGSPTSWSPCPTSRRSPGYAETPT
ncbi:alpha/beta fold hydrolase [Micromonospora parastrephiae]|uniref:alpha/beta fold hydrolase n=1 Tax=Micromonospora parastrephiae TaxID=2806101 RepID=UPI001EE41A6A|nr:alpha/beta hydrolase [Micromonospora parastrephiae]